MLKSLSTVIDAAAFPVTDQQTYLIQILICINLFLDAGREAVLAALTGRHLSRKRETSWS